MRREVGREAWVLGAILAVAFALRVAYVLSQRGDILFDYPVVDEETYVNLARRMADGQPAGQGAWFHPPGLTYALAAIFSLAGKGLLVPRLLQAAVSTASCWLGYVVARRLFSPAVALATAAVLAVHGVLVFETYELLPPTWALATVLLALWAVLRAAERATPAAALGAGAALGLAALFAPTVLPFALVAIALLRKPVLVGTYLVGLALAIAPVTWSNWQRGHEVVLVSTNGPINLYIGNNASYDDTLAIRPGPHWEALEKHPRSWFVDEAESFWAHEPGRALGLYLRKVFLYLDGPEIPRDTDVYAMRASSSLLSVLVTRGPPWLPDGVLVPLALVGAALCWGERRKVASLYWLVGTQIVVVAAFFVTSRYRVPVVPVLAMLACAGVQRIARGSRALRAMSAAGFAVLALILNLPTREASVSFAAERDFYRGMELKTYQHDAAGAVGFLRLATQEDPNDARFWFELGNSLDATGARAEAIDAWERAGQVDPWDARGRRRAGFVLAQKGDLDRAIRDYRANIDSRARDASYYASDHLSLALLYAREGRDDEAMAELHAAHDADPSWFSANVDGFVRTASSNPQIDSAFRDALFASGLARPGGAH